MALRWRTFPLFAVLVFAVSATRNPDFEDSTIPTFSGTRSDPSPAGFIVEFLEPPLASLVQRGELKAAKKSASSKVDYNDDAMRSIAKAMEVCDPSQYCVREHT